MKPKGWAKIWREIKRPLKNPFANLFKNPLVELLSDYMLTSWEALDDDAVERLCRLSFSKNFRKIATRSMLLTVISAFLEEHDYAKAKSLLEFYLKKYGKMKIEEFLHVSDFAQAHFNVNERIKTAASVFRGLRYAEQNNGGEELRGKTIAVVGNGPSQIGKMTGEEIDQHDIVIRFNNYKIDEKFAVDYGKKTSIWSTIPECFTQTKLHMCQFPVLWTDMWARRNIAYSHIESLDYFLKKTKFFIIPSHIIKAFKVENRMISNPSTGFATICWLTNYVGIEKEKIDIYGFAFNARDVNLDLDSYDRVEDCPHYFEYASCTYHNFNKECQLLAELLRK